MSRVLFQQSLRTLQARLVRFRRAQPLARFSVTSQNSTAYNGMYRTNIVTAEDGSSSVTLYTNGVRQSVTIYTNLNSQAATG